MKTNTIVGWMVVDSSSNNYGVFETRQDAREEVKENAKYEPDEIFRVCKVQVVH